MLLIVLGSVGLFSVVYANLLLHLLVIALCPFALPSNEIPGLLRVIKVFFPFLFLFSVTRAATYSAAKEQHRQRNCNIPILSSLTSVGLLFHGSQGHGTNAAYLQPKYTLQVQKCFLHLAYPIVVGAGPACIVSVDVLTAMP